MSEVWRCAGCGIEGPDTDRRCGCATSVVVSSVCKKTGEWKTGPSHHQWNARADLPPTLSAAMELPEVQAVLALLAEARAELSAIRAEVATLRASEVRMRDNISELESANASYQAALSKCGIDGSKGTQE